MIWKLTSSRCHKWKYEVYRLSWSTEVNPGKKQKCCSLSCVWPPEKKEEMWLSPMTKAHRNRSVALCRVFDLQRKRKRCDSVLWQKHIHPQTNPKKAMWQHKKRYQKFRLHNDCGSKFNWIHLARFILKLKENQHALPSRWKPQSFYVTRNKSEFTSISSCTEDYVKYHDHMIWCWYAVHVQSRGDEISMV